MINVVTSSSVKGYQFDHRKPDLIKVCFDNPPSWSTRFVADCICTLLNVGPLWTCSLPASLTGHATIIIEFAAHLLIKGHLDFHHNLINCSFYHPGPFSRLDDWIIILMWDTYYTGVGFWTIFQANQIATKVPKYRQQQVDLTWSMATHCRAKRVPCQI